METTQEPTPRQDSAARRLAQAPPRPESPRNDLTVRVPVLKDRHDDEEKEAGYGHGV
jgi:hypothetical protein